MNFDHLYPVNLILALSIICSVREDGAGHQHILRNQ